MPPDTRVLEGAHLTPSFLFLLALWNVVRPQESNWYLPRSWILPRSPWEEHRGGYLSGREPSRLLCDSACSPLVIPEDLEAAIDQPLHDDFGHALRISELGLKAAKPFAKTSKRTSAKVRARITACNLGPRSGWRVAPPDQIHKL